MSRTRRNTALGVAAGVLTLGAGFGAPTLAASADPTPTPSSPVSGAPTAAPPTPGAKTAGPNATHRHRGFGGPRGEHRRELVQQLSAKLGVSQDKVRKALVEFRDENRPVKPRTPGSTRPDPSVHQARLAKALASKLGLDEAMVKTALQEIRTTHRAERATALKARLDAAVQAGTLTQAEADAVTKAFEKGLINAGPR